MKKAIRNSYLNYFDREFFEGNQCDGVEDKP